MAFVTAPVAHTVLSGEQHVGKIKVKVDHTPERRVTELIRVLGSQPAGDTSHKHGGWLPFLSTKPTVTLQRAATNFAAW